jgi:hypothetical protein
MTTPEVFDHFADPNNDRSWWLMLLKPCDPLTPSLLTAAVRLSGMMDEAENETDLKDAVDHTVSMVNCGILDTIDWARESEQVRHEIEDYCDALEAEAARRLEAN